MLQMHLSPEVPRSCTSSPLNTTFIYLLKVAILLCRVVALFTPRIIRQFRKERTDNGSKPKNNLFMKFWTLFTVYEVILY